MPFEILHLPLDSSLMGNIISIQPRDVLALSQLASGIECNDEAAVGLSNHLDS